MFTFYCISDHVIIYYYTVDLCVCLLYYKDMLNATGYTKPPKKKTSQGNAHKRVKTSSMNKHKKRSFKAYNRQGK